MYRTVLNIGVLGSRDAGPVEVKMFLLYSLCLSIMMVYLEKVS
jgi:hypothetical protein